ncbi:MAG: hypothetical protein HY686_01845 [Chloroflexi bacterium]|nr:hypothetical protein [Chloroflexota bacterium]
MSTRLFLPYRLGGKRRPANARTAMAFAGKRLSVFGLHFGHHSLENGHSLNDDSQFLYRQPVQELLTLKGNRLAQSLGQGLALVC